MSSKTFFKISVFYTLQWLPVVSCWSSTVLQWLVNDITKGTGTPQPAVFYAIVLAPFPHSEDGPRSQEEVVREGSNQMA